MKKKILMLETALGADADPDGRTHGVKLYEKGQVHEVCHRLAKDFMSMNAAELVEAEPAPEEKPQPRSKKRLGAAPENK
jgi:hypothetical protein